MKRRQLKLRLKEGHMKSPNIEELMEEMSRKERFYATVYAMNTILQDKGVYNRDEFAQMFAEHAAKTLKKKKKK
jgi:hypothetical protein